MKKLLLAFLSLVMAGLAAAEPAKDLPREILVNGVEFVLVPEGWFHFPVPDRDPKTGYTRGSGRREVKTWVDGFYLAKYEARARDFANFMNSGTSRFAPQYGPHADKGSGADGATHGCSVRRREDGSYYLVKPEVELPATHLSWDLANEFATWMGFRLPTDAEWVRAFRGDDRRIYPWGDDYPDDTYAGFQEGGTDCNVFPITGYGKGRSPYGVYNMAGNTFEYVADWYNLEHMTQLKDGVRNPVATTPHQTPDLEKPHRMLRGGRWASGPGELSIYGNRDLQPNDQPFLCFGARFALDMGRARELLARGEAKVAP